MAICAYYTTYTNNVEVLQQPAALAAAAERAAQRHIYVCRYLLELDGGGTVTLLYMVPSVYALS